MSLNVIITISEIQALRAIEAKWNKSGSRPVIQDAARIWRPKDHSNVGGNTGTKFRVDRIKSGTNEVGLIV
jgi:hypothetical protein